MKCKTLDVPFEVKTVQEGGFFSGYGSVFDVVDSYREVVERGAFEKSLARWAEKGRLPPVLWNHNANEPIGVYTRMEEDERGLYVEGRLLVDQVTRSRETHALLEAGAIGGMSIGYMERRAVDKERGIRSLVELDLWEVSVVTFPANEEARVASIKSAIAGHLERGDLPSLSEFERYLREAGFSKSQATAIASHGLGRLHRSESGTENDPAIKAVSDALAILRGTHSR